jgi:hypothetical protein
LLNASPNIYGLIEGMLEKGLPYVVSQLEKQCKKKLIVCDRSGKVFYPNWQENNILPDLYVKIPHGINQNDHFYHRVQQRLYYHFGTLPSNAYIIISDIKEEQVSSTLSLLNPDIILALRLYFANLEKLRQERNKIKRDLSEMLYLPGQENIRNLLMLHTEEFNIFKPYFFSIMEADSQSYDVDWSEVRSYSEQYLKEHNIQTIQVPSSNNVMGLVPANDKEDTDEINSEWFINNGINHKKVVESRFKLSTSVGEGNVYPLSEIYKSYLEASISISLPKLMGERHFIKRFSDLGIFSLLYNNDTHTLNTFCHNTLGRLLDYDEANEGVLLPTLRILLDNCFNWKKTAQQMYVHVNTLHYRIKKVEQLMQIDLSQMENRVNTFLAIKLYDLMQFNKALN